jgi:hypothetical protein
MWTDLAAETDEIASTLQQMAATAAAAKHRTQLAVDKAEKMESAEIRHREERRNLKDALKAATTRAENAEAANLVALGRAERAERECEALHHSVSLITLFVIFFALSIFFMPELVSCLLGVTRAALMMHASSL